MVVSRRLIIACKHETSKTIARLGRSLFLVLQ